MIMFSQLGLGKQRASLLILYLGLTLFLIGCTRTPAEEASSDARAMPNAVDSMILGDLPDDGSVDDGSAREDATATSGATAASESTKTSEVTEAATEFLRNPTNSVDRVQLTPSVDISKPIREPSTVRRDAQQASPEAQRVDPTNTKPQTVQVEAEVDESGEPWIMQNLSYISETVFSEINTGRQDASLAPLVWDYDLEIHSKKTLDDLYSLQPYDSLDAIHNTEGYLIAFGTNIQLGETEMINRFHLLLDSNNSLRAGLFDDRFTRVGVASGLSIRPEEDPSYIYLCHISPSGEPLATIVPPEPSEDLSDASETDPVITGPSESDLTSPEETETVPTSSPEPSETSQSGAASSAVPDDSSAKSESLSVAGVELLRAKEVME